MTPMNLIRFVAAACVAGALLPAQGVIVEREKPAPTPAPKVAKQPDAAARARLAEVIAALEQDELSGAERKDVLKKLKAMLEKMGGEHVVVVGEPQVEFTDVTVVAPPGGVAGGLRGRQLESADGVPQTWVIGEPDEGEEGGEHAVKLFLGDVGQEPKPAKAEAKAKAKAKAKTKKAERRESADGKPRTWVIREPEAGKEAGERAVEVFFDDVGQEPKPAKAEPAGESAPHRYKVFVRTMPGEAGEHGELELGEHVHEIVAKIVAGVGEEMEEAVGGMAEEIAEEVAEELREMHAEHGEEHEEHAEHGEEHAKAVRRLIGAVRAGRPGGSGRAVEVEDLADRARQLRARVIEAKPLDEARIARVRLREFAEQARAEAAKAKADPDGGAVRFRRLPAGVGPAPKAEARDDEADVREMIDELRGELRELRGLMREIQQQLRTERPAAPRSESRRRAAGGGTAFAQPVPGAAPPRSPDAGSFAPLSPLAPVPPVPLLPALAPAAPAPAAAPVPPVPAAPPAAPSEAVPAAPRALRLRRA